mgnify:CR=1 FL=1
MVSLIEITSSENHISETYRLLKLRTSTISHKHQPTLKEHKKFVTNHPYRFWFLAKESDEYIGSVYLKYDNSIGLNITDNFRDLTKEVLQMVVTSVKPLPPSKSMRNSHFIVNVALEDGSLADSIVEFGGVEIQRTFLIP